MVQVRLGTSLDHRYNFVFGTAESTGTTSYVLDICTAGCKMLTHSLLAKARSGKHGIELKLPLQAIASRTGSAGSQPCLLSCMASQMTLHLPVVLVALHLCSSHVHVYLVGRQLYG